MTPQFATIKAKVLYVISRTDKLLHPFCDDHLHTTAVQPRLPPRTWLGLRCVRPKLRSACKGLSKDRHQHASDALATGTDLDIRNELLRVG